MKCCDKENKNQGKWTEIINVICLWKIFWICLKDYEQIRTCLHEIDSLHQLHGRQLTPYCVCFKCQVWLQIITLKKRKEIRICRERSNSPPGSKCAWLCLACWVVKNMSTSGDRSYSVPVSPLTKRNLHRM